MFRHKISKLIVIYQNMYTVKYVYCMYICKYTPTKKTKLLCVFTSGPRHLQVYTCVKM